MHLMRGSRRTGCHWRASACSDVARFDVHARTDGDGLLLDCQADLLSHLNTRLVAPLLPVDRAPKPAAWLNPVFEIEGVRFVMVAQYAAAVEVRELGAKVASLGTHGREILNALDVLISGI